jgi:hypothetical protein
VALKCQPFTVNDSTGIAYSIEVDLRDDIGWVYRWPGGQNWPAHELTVKIPHNATCELSIDI